MDLIFQSRFHDWKYITENQVNQLQSTFEIEDIRKYLLRYIKTFILISFIIFSIYFRLLFETFCKDFNFDAKKQEILVDFHYFNYA